MFGCIAAGRPVQTNLLALSPTQYTFLLATSPTQPLNHLVVFLLPEASLPPDTAASVYIQLTPTQPFQLLGAIGNDKPSAIFRIKGLSSLSLTLPSTGAGDVDEMTDETTGPTDETSPASPLPSQSQQQTVITLGISIEPISSVAAALSTLPPASQLAQTPRPATPAINTPSGAVMSKPAAATLVIARRIIRNAFNYLSGFAVRVEVPGQGAQEVVSLKAFQEWWVRFEKKVEFDPGVLERED